MSIESTPVAFFSFRGATGTNVPLSTMLDGIRGGKWSTEVQRLRAIGRDGDGYDKAKTRLPAFLVSASTNGGHKAADVMNHAGLLQLDIDAVGAAEAPHLRDRIGDDRRIVAAWISPTGDGVKGVMRIPADVARHKASFEAAADYMRENYNVEIDGQCSNVNRLCFVSHDPDLVTNWDSVVFGVPADSGRGEPGEYSSTSLPSTHYTLHNKAFSEFENLQPIYKRHVARFCAKPQRGHRNAAMVEIVSNCFCVVAPDFVLVFADEFFHQHIEVYQDYGLEKYRHESRTHLERITESYPMRLSDVEKARFAEFTDERHRTAFRIAQSLANCESDATLPPPLFALSACELGARMGLRDMEAFRILQGFQKSGIIQIERKGTRREAGKPGLATVYRWMLSDTQEPARPIP